MKRANYILKTGHFRIPKYPPSKTARKVIKGQKDNRFWLNTAADIYILYDINNFDSDTLEEVEDKAVAVVNNTPIPIRGKGNICVEVVLNDDIKDITFIKAYYVPKMAFKIISLGTLE